MTVKKIEEISEGPSIYPYVGRYVTENENVELYVLFVADGVGSVIKEKNTPWEVGEYDNDLDELSFKRVNCNITFGV